MFSIADPTLGISWRIGDSGEFRETGFIDTLDPRTRKRMPNPSIELAADAPTSTIQLRYVDASGDCRAVPIKFDPEAALIRDQRKILDMTATSWLSFREFNGLLVYYTHLMSYRCAIREVRVGIDSAVPDKVLKMPPCDPRDPSVIPRDSQPYLKLAPSTQFVSVELTDGSVSEIKSFRRHEGGVRSRTRLGWRVQRTESVADGQRPPEKQRPGGCVRQIPVAGRLPREINGCRNK